MKIAAQNEVAEKEAKMQKEVDEIEGTVATLLKLDREIDPAVAKRLHEKEVKKIKMRKRKMMTRAEKERYRRLRQKDKDSAVTYSKHIHKFPKNA